MITTKKQMFILIGSFILVILLGTVTYAFFNYTRTGTRNVIKTGRIYFSTSQEGTLNLTNVFPVASSSVGNDYTQDTLQISIEGDTTYSEGIEYLVTAEEVNVETSSGKKVPMTLKVAVTDDLGTQDADNDQIEYFTDRGSTTSYYKLLSESVLYDGQYLLVGYIAPGQTGIDGTINIKAYLDEDRVAISDTYPEGEVSHIENEGEQNEEIVIDGYNGTTSTWVDGRTVLTTNEWNSLNEQGNELSFKVKVEANEGTWVDPAIPINTMGRIPSNLRENITEVYFIKETPIRLQQRYDAASVKADLTETTLNEGQVLGWQEGNKLYIASTGETYLPENSAGYFAGLANVTKIEFDNINTSRVTSMSALFSGCTALNSLDLSNFNTSNVENMSYMFASCQNLTSLNISNFNTNNVLDMNRMFVDCRNLTFLNLSNFNTSNVENMDSMFASCQNLTSLNISNFNTSNVENMSFMFAGCESLTSLNLSNFNTSNVENMSTMFASCKNLTSLDLSSFNTSAVTNMYRMFFQCLNLESLDLSSFNTSAVTNMSEMFFMGTNNPSSIIPHENKLTTIIVGSSWNTSIVSTSTNMFYNCTHLVGEQGTTYDSNYIDKTYARIDGGPSNPGYLTLKTN